MATFTLVSVERERERERGAPHSLLSLEPGTDITNGEEVAIKLESVQTKHPQLQYESKLYRVLQGGGGCKRWERMG